MTTTETVYAYVCDYCGHHGRALRDRSAADMAGARHFQRHGKRPTDSRYRLLVNDTPSNSFGWMPEYTLREEG